MARVTINLLGYNHREKIGSAIRSVVAQSLREFELIYMDNASSDGSADYVRQSFPQVTVVANSSNLGYAGGHNLAIHQCRTELFMVLNPDVILDRDFLTKLLPVFDEAQVAAATGKMLLPGKTCLLDGTGIVIDRARRGKERGQHEVDQGQYDCRLHTFGVSGTAAVYRLSALEQVKLPGKSRVPEYFDEDFFAYWEDLDLSWRLRLAGYECRYVPAAVLYHERVASSSPWGQTRFLTLLRHHRQLPLKIRRWNWKNHLFCIIKNDCGWPFLRDLPFILVRELKMFAFILLFEPRVLGVLPDFMAQLPAMLRKRRQIQGGRAVSGKQIGKWFK